VGAGGNARRDEGGGGAEEVLAGIGHGLSGAMSGASSGTGKQRAMTSTGPRDRGKFPINRIATLRL
jgi:hypothetical protein